MQNPQHQQQISLELPKLQRIDSSSKKNLQDLPPIPDKLYFTISEAGNLCLVKPHVLRYWEQEFPQLNPATRRGKRRYYQRVDILLIRRIKSLLYEQGFTIEGARARLSVKDRDDSTAQNTDVTKFVKSTISQLTQVLSELEK